MTLRLAVLGTGYLGATHAACMADLGYDVLGMDVDTDKVASLSRKAIFVLGCRPGIGPYVLKPSHSGAQPCAPMTSPVGC